MFRHSFFLSLLRNSPTRGYASGLLRFQDLTHLCYNQWQLPFSKSITAVNAKHTLGRTPTDKWSTRHTGSTTYTTHNTQQTNIHALSRIRTHNPSNRAAADPRLQGHQDGYFVTNSHFVFKHISVTGAYLFGYLWYLPGRHDDGGGILSSSVRSLPECPCQRL